MGINTFSGDDDALAAAINDTEKRIADERTNLIALVAVARARGLPWTWVGDVFGVSRQAVWERFHSLVGESRR